MSHCDCAACRCGTVSVVQNVHWEPFFSSSAWSTSAWWWWRAYFCPRATGLLTKWASTGISRWPTVAADSLGGPLWGLGGTGLWTRDLCCLFTFSWFRSLWHTTVLLCQYPTIHSFKCVTRVCVYTMGCDRHTDRTTVVFFCTWTSKCFTCTFSFHSSDLILWHKLDLWDF